MTAPKVHRFPGIPNPTADNLLEVVRALKEAVEIGQRLRSVEGDSYTTYDEYNTLNDWVRNLRWDDMRSPATAITGGGASPPVFDTTYGGWEFANSVTRTLYIIQQIPHGWAEGTPLHPHVHWSKTSSASGDVMWELQYEWWRVRKTVSNTVTMTVSTAVSGTPDEDTDSQHLISAFDDITVGDVQISDILTMRLSRLGGNAADTYAGTARFLEFDIHHRLDSTGSIQEFVKSSATTISRR